MQNNPNTNNQLVDPEDWATAFGPYYEKPDQALRLGLNLAILRTELDGMLIKSQPVLEALDDALEILFPFTSFHDASLDLFIRFTEGKLTLDEEQLLNAMGVKI